MAKADTILTVPPLPEMGTEWTQNLGDTTKHLALCFEPDWSMTGSDQYWLGHGLTSTISGSNLGGVLFNFGLRGPLVAMDPACTTTIQ
jgi:hypothetical protein